MKRTAFPGRILFDHRQKTGGQAINAWLIDRLGTGCVTSNLVGPHRDLIYKFGGLYSIISGHVTFTAGESLDPRYRYATVLREPLDRATSWIYFLLNNVPFNSETASLKEGAMRFIETEGAESSDVFLKTLRNPYVTHFASIAPASDQDQNAKLRVALDLLADYDIVGFYEQMEAFVARLAKLIGISPPQSLPRVNVTSDRPHVSQLSDALRSRLGELIEVDALFYSAAQKCVSGYCLLPKDEPLDRDDGWPKFDRQDDRNVDRIFTTTDLQLTSVVIREGFEVDRGRIMTFDVDFELRREVVGLLAGIHIFDEDKRWAFGTNTDLLGQSRRAMPPGEYRATYYLIADLPKGRYSAGFSFLDGTPGAEVELSWHDKLCQFTVVHDADQVFAGHSYLPTQISISSKGTTK